MRRVKILLMNILIFIMLPLTAAAFASYWVSPINYIDLGGKWNNESDTYDEDIDTYADTLKVGIENTLVLTIPSILPCDSIRIFVADYKSGSFNPNVLIRIKDYDEVVTIIHDGIMNWGEWVKIEFAPKSIDTIYISANSLGGGHRLRVYEVDFGDPNPDYGKVGESANFNGDVGVPSGYAYYINGILLSIDDITTTNLIVEADLKSVNEPVDEYILTYEETGGDFEWHTKGELSIASSGANTDITSILNVALYVGRDADNQIKFASDNIIQFRTSGVDSVSIGVSGEIDLQQFYILMDDALGSDHDFSGLVDIANVGELVGFGDLLYYDWTDVEWKKAKADSATTMPAMRIALETKSDGQACLMLVMGYIRDDSAFEMTGAMVYVSDATAGAVQYTAPGDSGDQVQRVGIGIIADKLFFSPSIDVGEI